MSSVTLALMLFYLGTIVGNLQDVRMVLGLRQSSRDSIRRVVNNWMEGQKAILVIPGMWRITGGLGLPVYIRTCAMTDDQEIIEGYVLEMSRQVLDLNGLGSRKVVVLHRGTPGEEELIDIFRDYWRKLRAPNLIILSVFLNLEQSGEETVYVYDPFRDSVVGLRTVDDVTVALEARWTDMNGYELKVAIAPTYLGYSLNRSDGQLQGNGLDGPYLYELKRWMNFTVQANFVKGGVGTYDHSRGIYTGALRELVEGNVDMSLNARFIKWYHTTKIMFTGTVYDETICVVVKSQHEIRGWDVFLRIFKWEVWASIVAAAVAANHVLSWIKRVEESERGNVANTLPTTLRAMFMIPMTTTPITTAQRLMTGSCLFFGVVVVTTFQGELFSFVKSRTTYREVDTLVQLYDTGMEIITRSTMKDTFDGFQKWRLRALGTRLVINEGLMKPYWFDDRAVLVRMREYRLMKETGRLNYDFNLHVVEQCPRTYNLGYMFPRDSPFVDQIERKFTSRIFEAALLQRWYRETVGNERDFFKTQNYSRKLETAPELRRLSKTDFEVGFFSLILGLGIGLLCFIGELIIYSIKRKRQHRQMLPFIN